MKTIGLKPFPIGLRPDAIKEIPMTTRLDNMTLSLFLFNRAGQFDLSLSHTHTQAHTGTHTQYFKTRCHKRDTADNKIGQFDHQSSSERKKNQTQTENYKQICILKK